MTDAAARTLRWLVLLLIPLLSGGQSSDGYEQVSYTRIRYGGGDVVPITLSNEAFKLGVNYILYALTH